MLFWLKLFCMLITMIRHILKFFLFKVLSPCHFRIFESISPPTHCVGDSKIQKWAFVLSGITWSYYFFENFENFTLFRIKVWNSPMFAVRFQINQFLRPRNAEVFRNLKSGNYHTIFQNFENFTLSRKKNEIFPFLKYFGRLVFRLFNQ